MSGAFGRLWEHVFFRAASPIGLVACRTLVAAQALWILLSRPDLPDLVSWPSEFWLHAERFLPARFGILKLPAAAERALYVLLHGSLVAALFGILPRASCALSAVLLYHFAPFEEVLAGMPHSSFGGLTLPTQALFILAFARVPRLKDPPSLEYRWPLALVQLLFSFSYLFPTLSKLRYSGPLWFTGENIRNWALGNHTITGAPWSVAVASSPVLCWAIAWGTLLLEGLSPLVVVSPTFATLFVPVAFAFHFGIVQTLGYFFPSMPLLLLYLDWDGVGRRLDGPRREETG